MYLRIYAFIGYVSLSFLWRPLWYNFIDQKKTKWIALGSIPAFVLISVFLPIQIDAFQLYPGMLRESGVHKFESVFYKENAHMGFDPEFYDDLRQDMNARKDYCAIRILSLPSYRIEEPHLEVFVKYDWEMEQCINALDSTLYAIERVGINTGMTRKTDYKKEFDKRKEDFNKEFRSLLNEDKEKAFASKKEYINNEQADYRANLIKTKKALKQSIAFKVNGVEVSDTLMYLDFFVHQNFKEQGMLCNFPLVNIHRGTNELTLVRKFYNKDIDEFYENEFTVPFVF